MALIKCPECKKEVSTKADKCPHCGAPVKIKKTSGCAMIVAVVFGLLIVGSIAPTCSGPSPSATVSSVPQVDRQKIFNNAKAKFEASIAQKYKDLVALKEAGRLDESKAIVRQFDTFKRMDYKSVAEIAKEVYTSDALARLGKLAGADLKGHSEIYAELSRLNPTNEEYKGKAVKYAADWNQQQVKDIEARVEKMASNDNKGRLQGYTELSRLRPDNSEYVKQLSRYDALWKQQEALRVETEKKEAAERQRAAARKTRIESQFSAWDGAHNGLEKIIKKSMNDPDSYKHVETGYNDVGDGIIVKTTFRGKNAFGGVVTNWIRAKFTLDGQLVEIVSQGP